MQESMTLLHLLYVKTENEISFYMYIISKFHQLSSHYIACHVTMKAYAIPQWIHGAHLAHFCWSVKINQVATNAM